MNILIIRSSFQSDDFVRTEYAELLDLLRHKCNAEITIIGDENVGTWHAASQQNIDFVMVATGGVENMFKRIWSTGMLKTTTLIADGRNNSLAASLEILSYLSEKGETGRIIHGTNDEIVKEIVDNMIVTRHGTSMPFIGTRIGLFGQPSDWLIAPTSSPPTPPRS